MERHVYPGAITGRRTCTTTGSGARRAEDELGERLRQDGNRARSSGCGLGRRGCQDGLEYRRQIGGQIRGRARRGCRFRRCRAQDELDQHLCSADGSRLPRAAGPPAEPVGKAPVKTDFIKSTVATIRSTVGTPIETTTARWRASAARAGPNVREVVGQRLTAWRSTATSTVKTKVAALNPTDIIGATLSAVSSAARAFIARLNPFPALAAGLKAAGRFVAARTGAAGAGLRAAIASVGATARDGLLRRPGPKVAIASGLVALVGLGLAVGAEQFLAARHNVDAATLNENVPLSAEDSTAEDDAPQRLAVGRSKPPIAVEDIKGQPVAPVTKPGTGLSLLKADESPVSAIKPTEVKEHDAPALAAQALPVPKAVRPIDETTRIAMAVTPEKIAGEPVRATDAGTSVAQAASPTEMRSHGEIDTPGVTDPMTPLVGAPKPVQAETPAPARVPAFAPATVPMPTKKKAETPPADAAANKLSFAGEGLNALHTPRPPATAIEYLKQPTKSTEWVETFIKKFYLSSTALKEPEIRQIYSDPVDYYGEKNVHLERVAREMADYYQKWPKRHYKLVPGSISVKWASPDLADVTFLYDFDVSSAHETVNKGRGRARLTLDLTGTPGRIIREDGEVVSGGE